MLDDNEIVALKNMIHEKVFNFFCELSGKDIGRMTVEDSILVLNSIVEVFRDFSLDVLIQQIPHNFKLSPFETQELKQNLLTTFTRRFFKKEIHLDENATIH